MANMYFFPRKFGHDKVIFQTAIEFNSNERNAPMIGMTKLHDREIYLTIFDEVIPKSETFFANFHKRRC